MTQFDDMDQEAGEACDSAFGSSIDWRPRASTGPTGEYTSKGIESSDQPDPNRPIVTALTGIVTWKPTVVGPGGLEAQAGTERSAIEAFDVMLDFDVAQFQNPDGTQGDQPIKGDYFFLTEEYEGNRLVELMRDASDGSRRLLYWCSFPESGETQ